MIQDPLIGRLAGVPVQLLLCAVLAREKSMAITSTKKLFVFIIVKYVVSNLVLEAAIARFFVYT